MFRLKASLLLLFIGCLVNDCNGDEPFCHRQSSKPGLHFTDQNGPATLWIGCESELIDFICCTSNFREIVWYQSTDKKTWREFMLINNDTKMTSENNQVATITRLQRQTDSGYIRCVAHGDNGQIIENVAVIDIRNCSMWSDPPIPLNPRSNLTYVEASLRESINIMCSSFTGVKCEETVCVYGWYKRRRPFDDSDIDQIPEGNSSIRVHTTKYYRRSGLRIEAILSIANVTSDDYNGSFVCYALSEKGSADKRTVRLIPPSTEIKIPVIAAALGGAILVIAVILLLVNYQMRADLNVRIWWRKRQLKKTSQDATDYDVALLVSGKEPFALYLKQKLKEDFHLKVFSEDEDVNPGAAPISCVPESAKRSRSVLVVMTPEVHEDTDFLAIISEIISDASPVFVLYGVDSADMDTDPPRLDRNIMGAMAVRPPLRWPGRVCDSHANPPANGPDSLEEGQLVEYWEGSGLRQVRNFWKKLWLSLTKTEKPKVVSTRKVRTDSLSEPLV